MNCSPRLLIRNDRKITRGLSRFLRGKNGTVPLQNLEVILPSFLSIAAGLIACLLTGCGKNKFQKEVETEAVAVKLAREVEQGGYELITTAELKKLVDQKSDMVLVDAMPLETSYNKAHIAGARQFLFPKEAIPTWDSAQTGGSQEDYAALLGEDKEKPIVVYCGFVKCARSHNAAYFARQLGYTNVKRYAGGIYAWKGAGHATVAAK